jgi:hypothetical protein
VPPSEAHQFLPLFCVGRYCAMWILAVQPLSCERLYWNQNIPCYLETRSFINDRRFGVFALNNS